MQVFIIFIMLWVIFIMCAGSLRLEVMTIGLLFGIFLFLVWAIFQEDSGKSRLQKIIFQLVKALLVISTLVLPGISLFQQRKVEKETVCTTPIEYVVQKTIIAEVPEKKGFIWTGKVAIPVRRDGYIREETSYECYDENNNLITTFTPEEIDFFDSTEQKIEYVYKESKKIDHESDILSIHDEISFLKGECSKEHREYSHKKYLIKTTVYIDQSNLKYSVEYTN